MVKQTDTRGRMGRPPTTSADTIEGVALELFAQVGYSETTVDQIAAAAGINKRTFFRYFSSKADVFWSEFDDDVRLIRAELAKASPRLSTMTAIRRAVIGASTFTPSQAAKLRVRVTLTNSDPELVARTVMHRENWAQAVSDFVAERSAVPRDSLIPLAMGRAVLATCLAAYDRWTASESDADYTVFLDAALRALAAGFPDKAVADEPGSESRPLGS